MFFKISKKLFLIFKQFLFTFYLGHDLGRSKMKMKVKVKMKSSLKVKVKMKALYLQYC